MKFTKHIGIDYSGAGKPNSSQIGLRVFSSDNGEKPKEVRPANGNNWSRAKIAEWLKAELYKGSPIIVGIDHGFSYADSFFVQHDLADWDAFLKGFDVFWPTRRDSVQDVLTRKTTAAWHQPSDEFRLTERWTSSASSIRNFGKKQGNVAHSTHAGIAWLADIRITCRSNEIPLHFWPFDGWSFPESGSVIVEMYPSILRRRFKAEYDRNWSPDQCDAYALARWLSQSDSQDALAHYCEVPLTPKERITVEKEGWIFGLT